MENKYSCIDFLQNKKDTRKIYINKKNKLNLTICFCQCECDCHKNTTYTNHHKYNQCQNKLPTNLKLCPEKRTSFSKNFLNPIKKEYSFDYYNNNTDNNHKLTRESIDNKLYLNSRSDNNLDGKTDEFITRESLISNQDFELNNNLHKNKIEYFNRNNLPNEENEYILYRNDIKDFKQFIKTLHDIKKNGKTFSKCSSLKDFNSNTRPYIRGKINTINNKENNRNNNMKMNFMYENDNNCLYKDNKKKNKKLSIDNRYISKYLKDINIGNKTSYRRTTNSTNNTCNRLLKKSISQRNDLIYNVSSKDFYNKKNSSNRNDYKYYDYKEDIIKDSNTDLYFKYNNLNDNLENNSINPLGHIVDNFVSMLKGKNYKGKIRLNNKSLKYNDNIMKKKRILDNMSLSKIPNYSYNYNDFKYYNDIDKKIKNSNNNYNNNIRKNGIYDKKKEYEKKYIKKNNMMKNNKINNKKIINRNENLNKEPSSIYDNNKMYKFSKYKDTKTKKNTNYDYQSRLPNYKLQDLTLSKDQTNNYHIDYNNQYNSISTRNNFNRNMNKFQVEKFNVLIKNKEKDKNKDKTIYEIKISPSKLNKKIEIQNLSNITYYPIFKKNSGFHTTKANNILSKQKVEQTQILPASKSLNKENKKKSRIETVPERVRKLIIQKSLINGHINNLPLSAKLNLDTNLSISEENDTLNDNLNTIKRNISYSSKAIFTIYYIYEKPVILAFDTENKMFSFQNFSDFGNFEENYKFSKNFGNIFLNISNNLYIITGKNYDIFYMFDGIKKTMNKLCKLKDNHCNGNLLWYKNNIICLSGDYNKKVEIYSINKNQWDYLPDMLVERSNSSTCIIDNKENNNEYIINLFGYNSASKKYLNTIEYLDLNKKDSSWKYLKYNNKDNIFLNIRNFFCINCEENKIVVIGGCNEKENIYNDNYIEIILGKNMEEGNIFEEKNKKLKDINKKYSFCNVYKFIDSNNKNQIIYQIFDAEFNCHLFQGENLIHDVFYFCN